jgi:hypothetical protein
MAGFAFGLIIGYLSWFAFRPGETPETVPIQKIAALIAVIGGATVLALFPAGSTLFDNYGIGLAVGFFITPVRKWVILVFQAVQNFLKKRASAKESTYKKELAQVDNDWIKIERLMWHKLSNASKVDEAIPNADFVDITDLQELQYSEAAVEYIMRRYAQLHVHDGIEYRVWNGKPALLKKRW